MRVLLDAMGGDHAPAAPVEAAVRAMEAFPDLEVTLVGEGEAIARHLARVGGRGRRPEVVEARGAIAPDESPVEALREKPDASLPLSVRMLRDGHADALVSAGSTGAMMAAAALHIGLLPGVSRPALGAPLPMPGGGQVLLMDVGAHMDARPEVLVQYAVMGSLYLERVRGVVRPRVGLLNVGTEPGKGNRLVRAAHKLIAAAGLNFVGNVEARDIYSGAADLLVCDGFAGNLLLKGLEGLGLTIRDSLKRELGRDLRGRLGALLVYPALRRLSRTLDYNATGGVPLFGPSKVIVKCHGASRATALTNGLGVAVDAVRSGMMARMAEALAGAHARLGEA
ncbi:MAG: phosphate acyltransferase PlsX [Firmicutes bacterium]|nr:phosphate acyltransferase PlsX [Bacillota bacterium]